MERRGTPARQGAAHPTARSGAAAHELIEDKDRRLDGKMIVISAGAAAIGMTCGRSSRRHD
jgi:hypothetical protein